jgi:uncharacterized protein (DUF2147 family)
MTHLLTMIAWMLLSVPAGAFSAPHYENPNEANAIVGTWITANKKGHIKIYERNKRYFGQIVWLKDPLDTTTKQPLTDKNNPNVTKRSQTIMGLVNLRDFVYEGKNSWEDGKVYDPESGKEYSCKITLRNPTTLEVRGYVGIPALGRSEVWTRVP